MFRIILVLVFVIIAWKWGDWKNWKLYYPTILFMILGDFVYIFLTYKKPLWILESPLFGRTISDLYRSVYYIPVC